MSITNTTTTTAKKVTTTANKNKKCCCPRDVTKINYRLVWLKIIEEATKNNGLVFNPYDIAYKGHVSKGMINTLIREKILEKTKTQGTYRLLDYTKPDDEMAERIKNLTSEYTKISGQQSKIKKEKTLNNGVLGFNSLFDNVDLKEEMIIKQQKTKETSTTNNLLTPEIIYESIRDVVNGCITIDQKGFLQKKTHLSNVDYLLELINDIRKYGVNDDKIEIYLKNKISKFIKNK